MRDELKKCIAQINAGIVPAGYRKTKVGIVPEEWEVEKLAKISLVVDGTHQTPQYVENGIPFVSVENISDIYGTDKYISSDAFEQFKYKPQKNDILMTRITAGVIGDTCIVLDDRALGYYVSLALIRVQSNDFVEYINLFINGLIFKKELHKRIIHTAFPKKINLSDIGECRLTLPPLPEQQKIAEILTAQDSVISLMQKRIELKQQQKKALMQKLLSGEVRVGDGEWKKTEIGNCGDIITGNTPPTADTENYGSELVWVTPSDINGNMFISSSMKMLSEKGARKARRLKKGTVLVTCIASIGKNAVLDCEGSCNQQINAVYLNDNYNNVFFYYLICYNERTMKKYAGKSATQIISKEKFSNLVLHFPPLPEQVKIAEILSAQDREIELMQQQLALEQQKKKALMQLLLTGKVRVKL